tara:strand:- start:8889 stop:9854 length:966 start_codon:yes stop_codon:yes gene_type:complete
MAITYNPFESDHGFKGPGFSVDSSGNIVARSISFSIDQSVEAGVYDFTLSQSPGGQFRETEEIQDNPQITLIRGATYTFLLTLTSLSFSIANEVGSALYNTGLKHTSGEGVETTGSAAQGRITGVVTFDVPVDAPSTLRYTNNSGVPFGYFSIVDPIITGSGAFTTLTVAGNINAIGNGADIRLQPTGDGTVNISASSGSVAGLTINSPSITSTSGLVDIRPLNANLTLIARGTGFVTIDSAVTGSLNNITIGNTAPAAGSFTALSATSGNINGVIIGATTPAAGTFTTISTTTNPVNGTDLTNKNYVDANAIAFAIALGS